MRRVLKPYSFLHQRSPKPQISPNPNLHRSTHSTLSPTIVKLFETPSISEPLGRDVPQEKLEELREELVKNGGDSEHVATILVEKGASLFKNYADGAALVELLKQLQFWPRLALEVFSWRRNHTDSSSPMAPEEYAKGIMLAGKIKNVDLAHELFTEAAYKKILTTSTYNALMGAYMFNGLSEKCQSLFRDLKRDVNCNPTIVTYNILVSVFGRLMLVDHMEETYREIKALNLSPNLNTYNYLIAGYVTAWMWDSMYKIYMTMVASNVKPDLTTHLLMLRGYTHSVDLEKMEETYELVKEYVNENEIVLVRAMICAYCKSSDTDRVKKIKTLLELLPKDDYRPWLNVLLIRVYAQEDLVEEMEESIDEAFAHKTSVITAGIMRCIISCYFRCKAVDKLAEFVKRAESGGWRICRSLYHCKMVLYGTHNRFDEMESVLDEMDRYYMDPSQKSLTIMYHAYKSYGQTYHADRLGGMMLKFGFRGPFDSSLE